MSYSARPEACGIDEDVRLHCGRAPDTSQRGSPILATSPAASASGKPTAAAKRESLGAQILHPSALPKRTMASEKKKEKRNGRDGSGRSSAVDRICEHSRMTNSRKEKRAWIAFCRSVHAAVHAHLHGVLYVRAITSILFIASHNRVHSHHRLSWRLRVLS